MRIISQDKMTDTPYDGAVVYIHRKYGNQVYVGNVGDDEGFPIGTYNSKEDAVYVMQLIGTAFRTEYKCFYMPEAEEVPTIREQMKEASRNDTD